MASPIDVPCPICDALPGQRCWGARGRPREHFHADRSSVPRRERRPYDVELDPTPRADPLPLDVVRARLYHGCVATFVEAGATLTDAHHRAQRLLHFEPGEHDQ